MTENTSKHIILNIYMRIVAFLTRDSFSCWFVAVSGMESSAMLGSLAA